MPVDVTPTKKRPSKRASCVVERAVGGVVVEGRGEIEVHAAMIGAGPARISPFSDLWMPSEREPPALQCADVAREARGHRAMDLSLRQRFGRPLRLGVIGGGPESWIGRMHRGAAEFDGWWRVVAGVFSSDPARSRAAGRRLGFDAARSYGTVAEMLARRSGARRRHRRGRDHDAERHALSVRRRGARRRARRDLRQAGHARLRAGARSGRARAQGQRAFSRSPTATPRIR